MIVKGHASFRSIFTFTRKQHLFFLVPAFVFAASAAAIAPVTSILVGKLMNSFSELASGNTDADNFDKDTRPWIWGLIALGVATCVIKAAFCFAWISYGESLAKTVREELLSNLVIKEYEWFEAQQSGVSTLLSRLQVQLRDFQLGVSQPLGSVIETFFQTIFSLGVAFYYNWKLTLVLLATFPCIIIVLSLISGGLPEASDDQQTVMANATKQTLHVITNLDVLKCYNGLPREIQYYERSLRDIWQNYSIQAQIVARQVAAMRVAGSLLITIALLYGTHLVHKSHANPGDILSTFWCCMTASKGFNDVLVQMLVLEKGRAAAVALRSLISRVRKGKNVMLKDSCYMPPSFCGSLAFHDVDFFYSSNPDQQILRSVNLKFQAQQTTFVIGESGSGKSTLASLLLKLYIPSSGQITLDGMDVEGLDTNWLRNNVTLVPQESALFSGTISQNIALGHQNPEELNFRTLQQCIKFAVLEGTLDSLPHGIDTKIGRDGSNLSGGQRQRVALARARLRESPVLVLDESTSALDQITKASVMRNIREWRKDKTTIIITHDHSLIMPTDFVYVFRNGTVVAEGFHSDIEESVNIIFNNEEFRQFGGAIDIEQVLADRIRQNGSTRPSFERTNASTSSIGSYIGTSTTGDNVALLQRSIDSVRRRHDRGKRAQPYLKRSDRTLRREDQLDRVAFDEILDEGIVDQYGEVSASGRRASPRRHRFTVAQSMRPYSTQPAQFSRFSCWDAVVPIPSLPQGTMTSVNDRKEETETANSVHGKTPSDRLERSASLRKLMLTIWPSLKSGDKTWLVFALLSATAYSAVPAVSSWVMVHLFQTFYQADGWAREAAKWSCILVAIAFGEAVAAYSVHFLFEILGQSWINTLRLQAFTTVLGQPKSWYDAEHQSILEICTALDRAAEEMRNILGRFVPFVLIACVMILVSVIWCFITCWRLTLVGVGCAPVIYAVGKTFEFTSTMWESRTTDAANTVADVFTETFFDVRTIRALTLESHFHRKYMTVTSQAYVTGLKRSIWTGLCFGISDGMIQFVIAGMFAYAISIAHRHEFSVKDILIVLSLLIATMTSASAILAFIPQISSSIESGSRLLQLANLNMSTDKFFGLHKLDTDASNQSIELSNVTFSYPTRPETLVLSGTDLIFQAGEFTAIVGASGSGKSTILSLILGLYPIKEDFSKRGWIKIADHDIRDLDIEVLRSCMAYVPQQPVLFPTSIRQNILYGVHLDPEPSELRLHSAAVSTGIHEFIASLPEGYDTVVGDGGLTMSGGQAQRIVVARALARQPKILLMDEPTSALDPESAEVIKQSIRALKSGKRASSPTIIVVTHAPDMMKVADKVVVLVGGRVAEEGSFDELMSDRGNLFRLVNGKGV